MSTRDVYGLGDRAVARRTDPDTSHEAADSVSREHIALTQRRVLLCLGEDLEGLSTDEDLLAFWRRGWDIPSPSGLRTRRAELVARGLIEWTGKCTETRRRRKARVWRLTAAGKDVLADLQRKGDDGQ